LVCQLCPCGGTADTQVLETCAGNGVRVQISPRVPEKNLLKGVFMLYILGFGFIAVIIAFAIYLSYSIGKAIDKIQKNEKEFYE
jgi:hypothetical protein